MSYVGRNMINNVINIKEQNKGIEERALGDSNVTESENTYDSNHYLCVVMYTHYI